MTDRVFQWVRHARETIASGSAPSATAATFDALEHGMTDEEIAVVHGVMDEVEKSLAPWRAARREHREPGPHAAVAHRALLEEGGMRCDECACEDNGAP